MGIKTYKPKTPSLRFTTTLSFRELTRGKKAEKRLTSGKTSKAGRGAGGRISVRRRGGGHKRLYREIDFKRDKWGVPAKVMAIEYDPNRSAHIALLYYRDGEKRYILCPRDLAVGDEVISGSNAPIKVGNTLPLDSIPVGKTVHNVELHLGKGGQLVRTAGASAVVVAIDGDYASLRLPSGEIRMVFKKCSATIGTVGNADHMNVSLGKAGRARWMGRRPKVRGVAMNPVDHPHGGGEGKTSGGRHPVSPWGQPTKGFKTRKKTSKTDRFIVKKKK